MGFFPVDRETINYLKLTGRDDHKIKTIETYLKENNLWRDSSKEATYSG